MPRLSMGRYGSESPIYKIGCVTQPGNLHTEIKIRFNQTEADLLKLVALELGTCYTHDLDVSLIFQFNAEYSDA